ncbi:MAG: 6-bladed beta-propeller [Planctomycetes bacterium]|nr:6-bladed beta-propeller [Planctomycetota bacterium]
MICQFKKSTIKNRTSTVLFVLALAGAGCGPQESELLKSPATPLVWPEPPEQPRITYLGAVSTESDMEKPGSLFDGLGALLFGTKPVGILVSPYAVAVDPTGIMYVADTGGAVVHAFDLRTRDYRQFCDLNKEPGPPTRTWVPKRDASRLGDPSALGTPGKLRRPVALVTSSERVYVVDSGLRQVCVFKRNGEFLFAFGQDRLARPAGIACRHSQGTIYVADAGRHTICVFDHEGKPLKEIGMRGTGPGQFNFPTHLWVDDAGQLYVSDTLNFRIQVFDPGDRFVRMFGQQGDRPGNFAHPCGIATDPSGNIYVTDRQFENVQIFDAQGRILMALGQEGSGPGEFWLPAGLFIDGHGRLYVADSFNKRIQIFELLKETAP